MSFEVKFFLITGLIIILFIAPMVALYTYAFVKRVNRLTTRQAIFTWVFIFTYYPLFFIYAPDMIPKDMKVTGHQEMVCEIKTVYR